jgi:hypothetical protein
MSARGPSVDLPPRETYYTIVRAGRTLAAGSTSSGPESRTELVTNASRVGNNNQLALGVKTSSAELNNYISPWCGEDVTDDLTEEASCVVSSSSAQISPQGRVVVGRYGVVISDLEPLVEARRLLRDKVGVDVIRERLRADYRLESNEPDLVVAAARALVQYEAQDPGE